MDCEECSIHLRGCEIVQDDIQDLMNQGVLQVNVLAKNNEVLVIEPCINLPDHMGIRYQISDIVQ